LLGLAGHTLRQHDRLDSNHLAVSGHNSVGMDPNVRLRARLEAPALV
jgi:hypothetical protein